MVKTTKGGRAMNPADAYRKEQRKKEVARNKLERKFTREAVSNRDKPEEIKKQLQELIDIEEAGPLNKAQKLRKKVLQDAYDHALKKRKEEEIKSKAGGSAVSVPGAMGVIRPQDSRYYHPTLNPTGAPPPGKLAAVVIAGPGAPNAAKSAIPLPKPPPLPAGPAPKLPPPPTAPPLPAGAPPASAIPPAIPLPPPPGPPPGYPGSTLPAPLPPPSVPPPGWRLPPPAAPPPLARLPQPPGPPPGFQPPSQSQPMDEDAAPGTEAQAAATAAAPTQPGLPPPLQPPTLPPPPHLLPPPGLPPPGLMPPPPPLPGMYPPPHLQGALPPPPHPPLGAVAAAKANANATITASSTVVKRPLAHLDKSLTSMIPASVLVKREQAKAKKPTPAPRAPRADFGFGLAPIQRSAINSAPDPDAPMTSGPMPGLVAPSVGGGRQQEAAPPSQSAPVSVDAQYQEFLASMKEMGAL